jgi:hypothetical protein
LIASTPNPRWAAIGGVAVPGERQREQIALCRRAVEERWTVVEEQVRQTARHPAPVLARDAVEARRTAVGRPVPPHREALDRGAVCRARHQHQQLAHLMAAVRVEHRPPVQAPDGVPVGLREEGVGPAAEQAERDAVGCVVERRAARVEHAAAGLELADHSRDVAGRGGGPRRVAGLRREQRRAGEAHERRVGRGGVTHRTVRRHRAESPHALERQPHADATRQHPGDRRGPGQEPPIHPLGVEDGRTRGHVAHDQRPTPEGGGGCGWGSRLRAGGHDGEYRKRV